MKKIFKKTLIVSLLFLVAVTFLGCGATNLEKIAKGLSTYSIEIDYDDETNTLSAQQGVVYVNGTDVLLDNICFHLYPNAFRENAKCKPVSLSSWAKAYPNGASYGNIEISSVMVNGENAVFEIVGEDEDILRVDLLSELYPDEKVRIDMMYVVSLPNCLHRFGYNENTINLANFYPIACVYENGGFDMSPYNSNGDPFFSDVANYNVRMVCDNDIVVASTGETKQTSSDGAKQIHDFSAKAVRDFAIAMSKNFEVISAKQGNTKVLYYYHNDERANESLQTSKKALKTFSDMFGEYPYSTLSVVQTGFVHGGMEFPNLVYISDSLSAYEDYTNVIIHEIAHQWWYGIVGNNAYVNSWLDEGLTEYSTAMFYEKNKDYGIKIQNVMARALANYELFVEVYTSVFGSVDTTMTRKLNEFATGAEYTYIQYVKGMLLFENLREVVGDKKFFKSLKCYFKENAFKNATPDTLINAFEKCSKIDLEAFFDSWLNGKVVIKALA